MHEQVGVAERYNRTKLELACAMMFASDLLTVLWAEAINHATCIKNRLLTSSNHSITPFEARYRKKSNLSNVVPFGTHTWVKIPDVGKLECQAIHSFFMGMDETSQGYRIYFPEKRNVRSEWEVMFDTTPAHMPFDPSVPIPP